MRHGPGRTLQLWGLRTPRTAVFKWTRHAAGPVNPQYPIWTREHCQDWFQSVEPEQPLSIRVWPKRKQKTKHPTNQTTKKSPTGLSWVTHYEPLHGPERGEELPPPFVYQKIHQDQVPGPLPSEFKNPGATSSCANSHFTTLKKNGTYPKIKEKKGMER